MFEISRLCLLLLVPWHLMKGKVVGRIQTTYIRVAEVNSTIFTHDLLLDVDVESTIQCSRFCLNTEGCRSFTVTTTSSAVTCRGHAGFMTSASPGVPTADTSLWYIGWLEKPCNSSAECDVPLSECFAARCLCSPGYYYSHSTDSCVEDCSVTDLQPRFLAYPGYRIRDHNLESLEGMTQGQCLEHCRQHATARTCEYRWRVDNIKCHVQNVTKLDVPGDWEIHVEDNMTHYQKTCL